MKIFSYVLFGLCIFSLIVSLAFIPEPTFSSHISDTISNDAETVNTANGSHISESAVGSASNSSKPVSSKLPAEIQKENQRHQQKLAELEADYRTAIRKCETDIYCQKIGCTMSESECRSKIAEIDREIAVVQSEINRHHSLQHSGISAPSASQTANGMNLQFKLQGLYNKKNPYTEILNKYNTIRTLELKKIDIENKYTDAVLAECKFHEQELKRLNKK